MISADLLNPFKVDPSKELPAIAKPIPLWTEFVYFFCYDPVAKTGFTLHAGREPFDSTLWRATVAIYMPNNELLVAKCSGRDGHARGPGAGPLRITCVEPMRLWSIEFDGVCQSLSRSQNMSEAHRDSPGEPVKFHILFEGASPFWDMHQKVMKEQNWGSEHYEQICKTRGSITRRGESVSFSGVGCRDHSVGPRDYAGVLGNLWALMLFPSGRAVQAQLTRSAKLAAEIRLGYIFYNDGTPLEVVKVLECPVVNTADTPPASLARDPLTDESLRNFRIVLESSRGKEVIEGELLHSAAVTYLAPNDELLGTDFSRAHNQQLAPLQLTESAAAYRWNGELGHGVRERVVRVSTLK